MSTLIVDQAEVDALVAYARDPAHWYRPGPGATVPGDGSEHTLRMGQHRVVFTYTVATMTAGSLKEGTVFRHLSISVPQIPNFPDLYPSPDAVTEIAHAFGFTGALKDWLLSPVPFFPVIAVGQVVPEASAVSDVP